LGKRALLGKATTPLDPCGISTFSKKFPAKSGCGRNELGHANRHGLDHDRASNGLWTRLDVTVRLWRILEAVLFHVRSPFAQNAKGCAARTGKSKVSSEEAAIDPASLRLVPILEHLAVEGGIDNAIDSNGEVNAIVPSKTELLIVLQDLAFPSLYGFDGKPRLKLHIVKNF
jgi:hypothetical protein